MGLVSCCKRLINEVSESRIANEVSATAMSHSGHSASKHSTKKERVDEHNDIVLVDAEWLQIDCICQQMQLLKNRSS